MRIIGGKLKGSNLYNSKNLSTRPLKDLVKESIFNLLIHSSKISFKFEIIDPKYLLAMFFERLKKKKFINQNLT